MSRDISYGYHALCAGGCSLNNRLLHGLTIMSALSDSKWQWGSPTNTIELFRCYSGCCRVDAGDDDDHCSTTSAAADFITNAIHVHAAAVHLQADLGIFVVFVAFIFRLGLHLTLFLTSVVAVHRWSSIMRSSIMKPRMNKWMIWFD